MNKLLCHQGIVNRFYHAACCLPGMKIVSLVFCVMQAAVKSFGRFEIEQKAFDIKASSIGFGF